jgi:hypothetical protein
VKNIQLSGRTVADIDAQVTKVIRNLDNPEPPLDLATVRELLRLDRQYYSTSDDGLLRQTASRLWIAGVQVLKRPGLLGDAVRNLSLKALYLPDRKRILLDRDLPEKKHRWNEAHEMGHALIPWHAGMMLGDDELTLTRACHAQVEAEANYAAGRLLFLDDRFAEEANASKPSLEHVKSLSATFGNTVTSTLWRFVEQAHSRIPMVGLVTGHPHPTRRKADFDPAVPCRYCVESPAFVARFGHISEVLLFNTIATYCGSQGGGPLGEAEIPLLDTNGEAHVFHFATFFNRYEALTLGVWKRRAPVPP